MKKIKLATALNPVAARLIERYQLTQEALDGAKNPRRMTRAEYQDYLATDTWKVTRDKALAHYGRKCYLCGASGDVQIDVHHNTYERAPGRELMSDLIPLCHDCHQQYHRVDF